MRFLEASTHRSNNWIDWDTASDSDKSLLEERRREAISARWSGVYGVDDMGRVCR